MLIGSLTVPHAVFGQIDAASETTSASQAEEAQTALMSSEELQTLIGPVALFPDTLLVQVLVAATFPVQVIKADQYVDFNKGTEIQALKADIEEQGCDESVAVLATAFPDVLSDMADHIDWTDTIGTAMLAQSNDVMDTVQVMRARAEASGALTSGDEQTIEVVADESGEEAIIIQPTDPQVVYVPTYDTRTVYVENDSPNSGDVIDSALIFFATVVIIDNIFESNDNWYGYSGCRNCGGWNGRPIIRNPNIDIDINGNVNIGNTIGNGNRPAVGWKPEDNRRDSARQKISERREPDGSTKLPNRQPNRGDQRRQKLSDQAGVPDISRPANRDVTGSIQRPARDAVPNVPPLNKPAIDRTKLPQVQNRPAGPEPSCSPKTGCQAQKTSDHTSHCPHSQRPLRFHPQAESACFARAAGARGHASRGGRRR